MPISFNPMRLYMGKHNISYYYLANQGIDARTLQRIRHDRPITTETLGKLCKILNCQPGELIEYLGDTNES
ncbi:MAG: helix-turn-helix transcriptional regulator [Defluviitaleaceae bacterium]|nr:helix-turn-helix transcriptional regulator [Defluviitaleaceae bacterium]